MWGTEGEEVRGGQRERKREEGEGDRKRDRKQARAPMCVWTSHTLSGKVKLGGGPNEKGKGVLSLISIFWLLSVQPGAPLCSLGISSLEAVGCPEAL